MEFKPLLGDAGHALRSDALHLIVLHHGLWGTTYGMDHAERSLKAAAVKAGRNVEVLNYGGNTLHMSYNGIDGCGARLAHTIIARLKDDSKPIVTHISFAAHSIGGLVCNYAAGILHSRGWFVDPETSDGHTGSPKRRRVVPVHFATFATPHLGIRKSNPTRVDEIVEAVTCLLIGRSATQMMTKDGRGETLEDSTGDCRAILACLADPRLPFWGGLKTFKH
ncbi:hypothetical protein HK101_005750, partial [Irineochytrium annulatum]